jgi:hypothetical protein
MMNLWKCIKRLERIWRLVLIVETHVCKTCRIFGILIRPGLNSVRHVLKVDATKFQLPRPRFTVSRSLKSTLSICGCHSSCLSYVVVLLSLCRPISATPGSRSRRSVQRYPRRALFFMGSFDPGYSAHCDAVDELLSTAKEDPCCP